MAGLMLPALAVAASPSITPEPATEVGVDAATLNASVNPNGQETTYRFEYGTTTSYGKSVPVPDKAIGSGKEAVKVSETISGLTSGTIYHFRVVAANVEGTGYGADKSFATEVDSRFSFAFGSKGTGNGQFELPLAIAIDSSGNLWVTEQNNRVQEFNSKGEYLSKFGSKGTGNGQFELPAGIAIDASGDLWVTDWNNRVQEFNAKGEYLSKFGTEGSGNGQFIEPEGIAIDSSGNLWVVDSGNERVQKFNAKGEYLSKFGTGGSGNGQFNIPTGIAIDSSGNLWVVDVLNHRVQKFNAKGEYLSKFGTEGRGNGQFELPIGIAIDSSGDLWVSETNLSVGPYDRVQHFSSKGEYLSQLGTSGSGEGQFINPAGLAVDAAGNLWVADAGNNRVQEWVP